MGSSGFALISRPIPIQAMQNFDWRSFGGHGLATTLCCGLIALALVLAQHRTWDVALVYSLSIGLISWLVIDLGRWWWCQAQAVAWPRGWRGGALLALGIGSGFVFGKALGDAYSGGRPEALHLWTPHDTALTLAITVVVSVSMSFFFYSRGKARFLETQMALAQRDAAQARLKLLEVQLEPHMVFNTLANLHTLIATDPVRAQTLLEHLIAYLRATLGGSRSTQHPLTEEFERVRDYLEIMAVRMGARLTYTLDLPEALHDLPVPPLLLQPLVENAIRHGLEPQVQGGHLLVQARVVEAAPTRLLQLQVLDNGVGLAATAAAHLQEGGHFGLAQVRERLSTLHGPTATLELAAASAGGTSANITLPLPPETCPT
ncbi:hypothetical protein GCM10027395_06880 [Giesbergeria sinuosa]